MTIHGTSQAPAAVAGSAGDGAGGPGGTGGAGEEGGGPPHRLLAVARAVEGALADLAEVAVWSMSVPEQQNAMRVLDRAGSRLAELGLRVLAAAEPTGPGGDGGATSTATWLAGATRQTRARCGAAVRLAQALQERYDATRTALAAGRVNPDQGEVIAKAVDALTRERDDLPPDGQTLRTEEERARRTASLTMRANGDGTVEGRFRLPVPHGALLTKAVQALTAPRRLGEGRMDPTTGKKLPHDVLLGQGLTELLENHLDPTPLPTQAGSPFTPVVTIGIDALTTGIGAATLETQEPISAGQPRRLARRAGLIPMVRRRLGPPRPGPPAAPVGPPPTDRTGTPVRRLRHRRLRPATIMDPHPPPTPLAPRRTHRSHRRTTTMPTPPPHGRPPQPIEHADHAIRHGPIQQTPIGRRRSYGRSARSSVGLRRRPV